MESPIKSAYDSPMKLDAGVGLPSREENLQGGSGLRIIKYRAEPLGATLSFVSRSPSGTMVTGLLPFAAEPPAA